LAEFYNGFVLAEKSNNRKKLNFNPLLRLVAERYMIAFLNKTAKVQTRKIYEDG
jgi:hypothetical protein